MGGEGGVAGQNVTFYKVVQMGCNKCYIFFKASLRDGKIPQKEVDGKHNIGSQNKIKTGNNSQNMNHDHSLWPGSRPSVVWPASVQYSVWRNDKQWNQQSESQDFPQHSLLPFLNRNH